LAEEEGRTALLYGRRRQRSEAPSEPDRPRTNFRS
jgi:hypothetical protein